MANEPWIAYAQPRPDARLRLFCFHFAGGAASAFRGWQDALPAGVEVRAIQLPGRENRLREGLLDSMDAVLPPLTRPVLELLDLPAVFFGHSMGALVAFEFIRALRRSGQPLPLHFFPAGRRNPGTPCRFPDIHDLPRADLLEAMRKYGGTPDAILNDPEMMELILPIVRADFKILETYQFRGEAPLDLPITVYAGHQDIRTNQAELRAWGKQTTGPFALRMFEGEHFFISTHRTTVLEALSADLEEVLGGI